MAYQARETKWQKTWRLLKKWHPWWLPLAIIFFDRLFIMWPYIPIGEATVYMKAQAVETFDASIWWAIHVAETLFLLIFWLWLVCVHILLTLYLVLKFDQLWKEQSYMNQVYTTGKLKVMQEVAQEQVYKYFSGLAKQAQQTPCLLNYWPTAYFEVRALTSKEYRQKRQEYPLYKFHEREITGSPEDVAQTITELWRAHRHLREVIEQLAAARQAGEATAETTTATGEEALVASSPVAPAAGEEEQASAGDHTGEQAAARISVERALYLIQNEIEAKNIVRQAIGRPLLTAAEKEAIKQAFFDRVDPEELAAWRAQQEEAAAPGAGPAPESPALAEQDAGLASAEESGLVCADLVADSEMPDDDEYDEYEDDEVTPERWSEALRQADGNPLVAAIMLLMENRDEWRGSSSELLFLLQLKTPIEVQQDKSWPQNHVWLTRLLQRDAEQIKQQGIEVREGRNKKGRYCSLHKRN